MHKHLSMRFFMGFSFRFFFWSYLVFFSVKEIRKEVVFSTRADLKVLLLSMYIRRKLYFHLRNYILYSANFKNIFFGFWKLIYLNVKIFKWPMLLYLCSCVSRMLIPNSCRKINDILKISVSCCLIRRCFMVHQTTDRPECRTAVTIKHTRLNDCRTDKALVFVTIA